LAIILNKDTCWSPNEWISKILFKHLVNTSEITDTIFESELKGLINEKIKQSIWLIDLVEYSEPYQLEILSEMIKNTKLVTELDQEQIDEYVSKIKNLETIIDLEIASRKNKQGWNYISGWEEKGKINSSQLEEWAFSENGIFQNQDEDLLFYNPDLIEPIFKILGAKWNNRNQDLKKIFLNYYQDSKRINNKNLMMKFEKLELMENLNEYQKEIIKLIKLN
jgi:hypothetical protein